MAGKYAAKTQVPVDQSRSEIERTLKRYGADAFGYGQDGSRAVVTFRLQGRMMRIDVTIPDNAQRERQRWRALLLIIKARCEAIDAGIETIDQAFMPYILLPNGGTVGEFLIPQVAEAYETGAMPSLLPGVRGELGA